MSNVYSIIYKLNSTDNQQVKLYVFKNRNTKPSKLKLFLNDLKKVEFKPKKESVDKLKELIYN